MNLKLYLKELPKQGEEKLVLFFIGLSLFIHVIFFVVDFGSFFRRSYPVLEEWSFEADLIDIDNGSPDKTSMPKAEVAEKAAVPVNMLPQVTKSFTVDEKPPADQDAPVEEVEKKPEEVKKEETKPDAGEKPVNLPNKQDEANRLEKEEALRRLAMEKLRRENQTAKKLQAPNADALTRLKRELQDRKDVGGGIGGAEGGMIKRYMKELERNVRRNYQLPAAYNLKGSNLRVGIGIVISERGDLMKAEVIESSGDKVFDEYSLKALRDSVPLPKPPQELLGSQFTFNFKP